MNLMKTLRAEIEAFLASTGMAPTRFGVEIDGDRHLVRRVRAGRPVSIAKAERIMAYIRKREPARKNTHKKGRRIASAFNLVA